jgi:hypothetical protein
VFRSIRFGKFLNWFVCITMDSVQRSLYDDDIKKTNASPSEPGRLTFINSSVLKIQRIQTHINCGALNLEVKPYVLLLGSYLLPTKFEPQISLCYISDEWMHSVTIVSITLRIVYIATDPQLLSNWSLTYTCLSFSYLARVLDVDDARGNVKSWRS